MPQRPLAWTYSARQSNSSKDKPNSIVAFFTAVAITSVFIISMKSTEVPAKIIIISDCKRPLSTAADKNALVGMVDNSIVESVFLKSE